MAAEESEEPLISAQQQLGRFISILFYCKQCLGSGLDLDSVRSVDPDPDPGGQK